MPATDHEKLKTLKEEIQLLSPHNALSLKTYIGEVIKTFNYQDLKLHGHLNELLLTLNTEEQPDPDNFNDIRKKLIYLIDTIVKDY